jgi:hypothetical protein
MVGMRELPTVVSLAPLPLEADSRAFRIARSLADFGLRSLVIEGRPSKSRFWGPEIEVQSSMESGRVSPRTHRIVNALRNGRFGRLGELALYAGFRGYDQRTPEFTGQRAQGTCVALLA